MKTYDLVLLGKQKQGLKSDREFALHNGLSVQNISDWKAERANPNTTNFLILIEAAGLGLKEAKEIANAMEKRKNLKQAGFANVFFLSSLSLGSLGAMTLMKMSHIPYAFDAALMLGLGTVYYVKLNIYNKPI